MGKDSCTTMWSSIAGTLTALYGVLWIFPVILVTLTDFLPEILGAMLGYPYSGLYYSEGFALLSRLQVGVSLVTLAVALVFLLGSLRVGRRYKVPSLFAAGVAFAFMEILNLTFASGTFLIAESDITNTVLPSSFFTFLTSLDRIYLLTLVFGIVLAVLSSFLMYSRTRIREFRVAGVLFMIFLFIWLNDNTLSFISFSHSFYSFLSLLTMISSLAGAFAAGALIVLGVALLRIAKSEDGLQGQGDNLKPC